MTDPDDQPRDFGCLFGLLFVVVASVLLWKLLIELVLWLFH